MIYLVTKQLQLFECSLYKQMSIEDAIKTVMSWPLIQFDTETSGRNAHICKILCAQFGYSGTQIVVDTTCYPITLFKEALETKLIIGQNLKFDLQFLYNYEIVPTKIWDTMIAEQVLFLGFDPKYFHVSLAAIADRRLHINIDKTVRGEIIWRGLDPQVVVYAAGDVMYLEDIKAQQEEEAKKKGNLTAIYIENSFVPVCAYIEWCGIMLDVDLWRKNVIEPNKKILDEKLKDLNNFIVSEFNKNPKGVFSKYISVNLQGDLFNGFDTSPKCNINWSSSRQLTTLFKELGFSVDSKDKATGAIKESVTAKIIKKQKGVNDAFLNTYLEYKQAEKVCTTYGENYIDAINPKTGRIHTKFKQIGADTSRMSCGGGDRDVDTDLAVYKKLPASRCKFVQLQNLPHGQEVRRCFISAPGYKFVSCDYSALEARLGADIYQDKSMLDEFLYGSGDTHSLYAKIVFKDELKDVDIKDVKSSRPDLRTRVKPVEFAIMFGGGARAVSDSLSIPVKEAQKLVDNCLAGLDGLRKYKEWSSKSVCDVGYITICQHTGLKTFWEDFSKWKEIEAIDSDARRYMYSKEDNDEHNMAKAKWQRKALNSVTQGTGAEIIKLAGVLFFRWIVTSGYFGKVRICDVVHDEYCVEYTERAKDTPQILKKCMEEASSMLCTSLPIPACPEVSNYWIH